MVVTAGTVGVVWSTRRFVAVPGGTATPFWALVAALGGVVGVGVVLFSTVKGTELPPRSTVGTDVPGPVPGAVVLVPPVVGSGGGRQL